MNRKSALIAGSAMIFVVGLIATSGTFTDASGESDAKKSAPQYSETCAHGHNGFDCKKSSYRTDIDLLEKRTAELENRVAQLEKRR